MTVIVLAEVSTMVAGAVPKSTALAPMKLLPVTTTVIALSIGPEGGLTAVMTGAAS